MKKNLEIQDFEDKKTKAGMRFTRFKTSEGWMSCFDEKSCEMLKKYEGKTASVEVVEAGDFKNIKKCYGDAGDEDENKADYEVVKPGVPQETKVSSNRNTTMYVSYVKDLIVAGADCDAAIIAITKAKKAFE